MSGLPSYPERERRVTHSPCLSAKKETKSSECLEPMNLDSPLNSCSWSCRISRHLAASADLGAHTASCHGYLRTCRKEVRSFQLGLRDQQQKTKRDPKQVCNCSQHSQAALRIDKSSFVDIQKKRNYLF